jgi:class 3 adenylate cyclase
MESHGTPGNIQISRATYELIADEFAVEALGVKAVKGKGDTEVWQVTGRRSAAGATSARNSV